jgi:hypothetical protein
MVDEELIKKWTPQLNELGITDPEQIRLVFEGLDQIAEIGWLRYVKKQRKQNKKTEPSVANDSV